MYINKFLFERSSSCFLKATLLFQISSSCGSRHIEKGKSWRHVLPPSLPSFPGEMLEVSELSCPGVHFIHPFPLVTFSTRAQAGAEQKEETTDFLATWPCKCLYLWKCPFSSRTGSGTGLNTSFLLLVHHFVFSSCLRDEKATGLYYLCMAPKSPFSSKQTLQIHVITAQHQV